MRASLRLFQAFAFLSALVLMPAAGRTRAGDWPCWRGPTGLGYTDEKDLPLVWDGKSGKNVIWKTPLVGGGPKAEFSSPGHSCPIVWRDRVFITTAIWPAEMTQEERRKTINEHHVLGFQANDGKQLWDTVVPAGKCVVDNFYHGYAVPTPATDGKRIFALFGSGVLACLDFDGKIIWREELPRSKDTDGGTCSSPVLYEELVIIPGLGNDGLRAYEKSSGKLKWEQKTRDRNRMATPLLLRSGAKAQLIHLAGGVQALDPASGELLWSCRNVPVGSSSPAFGGGLLYTDSGRGGKTAALVDPSGSGDVTKTHMKMQIQGVPGGAGSSAIIVDKYVYRGSEPGKILCWELATGELMYEERALKLSPCASPIATADGRIYIAGPVKSYVFKAGPKFEQLAVNDLESGGGSQDYTTMAVSNGRLYFKGRNFLWCVGEKK
jgi:outer membrane protein assembly factor BamB